MNPNTENQSIAEDDEISLLDLLQTIAENIKLLVLGPLVVGLAALGISFTIPPTYTANTRFLPPQQQASAAASMLQSLGALGGLAGAAAGIKSPADQYVAFLKSRAVQDPLIEQFNLVQRYESKLKEDARKALATNARISSGKDGLISIEVDDSDPAVAADLANAHVTQLGTLLNRLAVTEAQQRRVFFDKQLQATKANLAQADAALRATGLSTDVLKAQPQAAVTALAQLQAQISAQEVKVASMRGYLTESAPDFKQAMTELAALRAQMGKVEASATTSSASGVGQSNYISRYRDFKYHEALFELFAKQYEIARVDEAREGAVIQVLDAATPPERKSKPKKALIAIIATLATGFVLLLFVFVRQAFRNAGQNPESAAKWQSIRQGFGFKA
ncbi:MAG TPA: Wzz/FepE/Etk N-terminal domain-containing protein [Burkholderiaceae bacterium]|nr:Wzz/FepE/Etk N-terminal domain-containing protein [Burkholderiaceae bacterium]